VNGERYPADLISTDYISPEAFTGALKPRDLGREQDLYALAVIIFQLMNYGTHPFQGVVIDPHIEAATNDEKAYKRLYPHGMEESGLILPRPGSAHKLVHKRLRKLFDEAFTSVTRPSAGLWAKTIQELLEQKSIVRCRDFPSKPSHMRFRTLDCPECFRGRITRVSSEKKIRKRQKPGLSAATAVSPSTIRSQSAGAGHPQVMLPQQHAHVDAEKRLWILGMVIVLGALLYFGTGDPERSSSQSVQTTTQPATYPQQSSTQAESSSVRFSNTSTVSVTALFITPRSYSTWGENRLSERFFLPNHFVDIDLHSTEGCIVDVRIEFADGRDRELRDQDRCKQTAFIIW